MWTRSLRAKTRTASKMVSLRASSSCWLNLSMGVSPSFFFFFFRRLPGSPKRARRWSFRSQMIAASWRWAWFGFSGEDFEEQFPVHPIGGVIGHRNLHRRVPKATFDTSPTIVLPSDNHPRRSSSLDRLPYIFMRGSSSSPHSGSDAPSSSDSKRSRPLPTTLPRVLPKQNLLSITFNLAYVGPDLPHTWHIGILPPHPHEHI